MEYYGCGEEYNMEKMERGRNIIFPLIEGVEKNIKWGKGEGDGNFGGGGKKIKI